MRLTATTHTLEVVTATGADVSVCASWVDHDATPGYTPGSYDTAITTATTTTIVAAPAASTQRQIREVSIRNVDTTAQTVTLQKDVSATDYPITKATLDPGWALVWSAARGFEVRDSANRPVIDAIRAGQSATMRPNINYDRPLLTTARALSSGSVLAVNVGRASRALTGCKVRWGLALSGSVFTWGEIGLYVGEPVTLLGARLRCVGYTDTATDMDAVAGAYSTTITATKTVRAGDNLWIGFGAVASGMPQFEAVGEENLSICVAANFTSRPSIDLAGDRERQFALDGVASAVPVTIIEETY